MQKDIKPILEKVESGTYNEEEERIAKLWLFQLRSKDLDQISEAFRFGRILIECKRIFCNPFMC